MGTCLSKAQRGRKTKVCNDGSKSWKLDKLNQSGVGVGLWAKQKTYIYISFNVCRKIFQKSSL